MFKQIIPTIIAISLLESGIGLLNPLIAVQLSTEPSSIIGILSSLYSLGFILGSLIAYKLIKRIGHIRAFGAFAILASNSILIMTLNSNPYLWMMLRFIQGITIVGIFIVIESWLNDKSVHSHRGRTLSIYTSFSWIFCGLSPLLFNIFDANDPRFFVIATFFIAASTISMIVTKISNPKVPKTIKFDLREIIRTSPLGFFSCLMAGFINGAIFALLPLYTNDQGLSNEQLSLVIFTGTIGTLIGQYPIGYISDTFGRKPTILITTTISFFISLLIYLYQVENIYKLLGMFMCLNIFASPLYALGIGKANECSLTKDFVSVSSGLLFTWGVGSIISPFLIGYLIDKFNGNVLFLTSSIGFLSVAIFTIIDMTFRKIY